MIQINPSMVPYATFLILKWTTIRLGLSVGIWGTSNHCANPMECPSYRAIMATARCFSQPTGINYGKHGLPIGCFNARTKFVHTKDGHCYLWTIQEEQFLADILYIFCWVCATINIPVIIPCFGGTAPFRAFKHALKEFNGGKYQTLMRKYVHLVPDGTRVPNIVLRRRLTWRNPHEQVSV